MVIIRAIVLLPLMGLCICQDGVIPEALQNGNAANPGARLRITKQGVDYFGQVLSRLLNAVIPQVRISQLDKDFNVPLPGHLTLTDLTVTSFKAPASYSIVLQSPDHVLTSVRNMDVSLASDYQAVVQNLLGASRASGKAKLSATGMNLDIAVSLDMDADGKPHFTPQTCTVTTASSNVDYTVAANLLEATVLNGIKPVVQLNSAAIVQQGVCDQVLAIINGVLNKSFSKLGRTVALNVTKSSSDDSSTGAADGGDDSALQQALNVLSIPLSSYQLDYRLLRKPTVTSDFLQSEHRGEISYQGQGGTPFYPRDMPAIDSGSGRMFYATVSDYVFNSLLYAAYSQHETLIFSQDTVPSLAGFLRTSCDDSSEKVHSSKDDDSSLGTCFGDVFAPAGSQFPNRPVEFDLVASKQPFVVFSNGGAGDEGTKLSFQGTLTVFGLGGDSDSSSDKDQWIVADLSTTAVPKLYINNTKLYGSVKLKDVQVNVRESVFDAASNAEFNSLAKFAADLLMDKMDAKLGSGLPLPKLRYAKLTNAKLDTQQRSLAFSSDLTIDEAKLQKWVLDNLLTSSSRRRKA